MDDYSAFIDEEVRELEQIPEEFELGFELQ